MNRFAKQRAWLSLLIDLPRAMFLLFLVCDTALGRH